MLGVWLSHGLLIKPTNLVTLPTDSLWLWFNCSISSAQWYREEPGTGRTKWVWEKETDRSGGARAKGQHSEGSGVLWGWTRHQERLISQHYMHGSYMIAAKDNHFVHDFWLDSTDSCNFVMRMRVRFPARTCVPAQAGCVLWRSWGDQRDWGRRKWAVGLEYPASTSPRSELREERPIQLAEDRGM